MDLREKPGAVQKFLELMLRLRLIFVVLMVVFAVTFLAKDWQAVNTLPIAASEGMGMSLAEFVAVSVLWWPLPHWSRRLPSLTVPRECSCLSTARLPELRFCFCCLRNGVSPARFSRLRFRGP